MNRIDRWISGLGIAIIVEMFVACICICAPIPAKYATMCVFSTLPTGFTILVLLYLGINQSNIRNRQMEERNEEHRLLNRRRHDR